MSSNHTNRSKMSPVRQNPASPARNVSMSAWKYVATCSKYRQEKIMAAVTSTAARQARPADSGPAVKSMPIAAPWNGRKPANQ